MIYIEKSFDVMSKRIPSITLSDDDGKLITEASKKLGTYIIRDELYPAVAASLDNPSKERRFKKLISDFFDRNADRLSTSGPMYMIATTDEDKRKFFSALGVPENTVKRIVNKVTKKASNARYLRNNPLLWVLFCAIRYYTLKKDVKGLNTTLAMYAFAVYPSIFYKYFQYGVTSPGTMEYTMDSLTDKFILKQKGTLFAGLTSSIQNSFRFLSSGIADGSDDEAVRFILRIRNDQNSMIKRVANQYMINHAKGLTVGHALDTGNNGELIDTYTNDTSQVATVSRSIVLQILTNGIKLDYVSASAKIASISSSDLKLYLSKILVDNESKVIEAFIESILFIWLYDEHHTKREINTSAFLLWSINKLFKRTNSNDSNIARIKETLNRWGDISGIHQKFTREASRINYKKAIFVYFILSIQYYTND